MIQDQFGVKPQPAQFGKSEEITYKSLTIARKIGR